MNVDLPWKLERDFKVTMIQRSPKLTVKKAVIEAIEMWIKNQKEKNTIIVKEQ